MWPQTYTPVSGSLAFSTLVAALPIFTLLILLAVLKRPAWLASLAGLAAALGIAIFVYRMPLNLAISSAAYGASYGLLPIGWIVFTAILLYRLTIETGKFEIIKDSIGSLTGDRRLQALLIAFAFGAFIEGAAGFGTPVAVAAAMLTGLGFSPFYAAALCLLANTSPVAFGSIGTPLVALQGVTQLPMTSLASDVGRLCAPVSLFVPSYLILVMGGVKALRAVFPAAALCGVVFAAGQFFTSNFSGSYLLTDIIASLAAIAALVGLLKIWKPRDAEAATPHRHTGGSVMLAWTPYACLVVLVLAWGQADVKAMLNHATWVINWPGLHNLVLRMPPIARAAAKYPAPYTLNLLSASGTACLFAVFVSAAILRVSPRALAKCTWTTARQLALSELTIAAVVGLAYVMNYSGATATLGLAFAATGVVFPFFSSLLGWLGVFLTGSDTASNALFGTLQSVTAGRLGLNASLMAAANSTGGVMGKMISLQSIAVAGAATGMAASEEGKLFRFTLKHSLFMAAVVGAMTLFYAYVMPGWVK
ncbi:MAG TPA: L-lactate permease [Bryobacteraceae bacterium]|nr:L-lactate permease [Bryobacteraceae bacterium]